MHKDIKRIPVAEQKWRKNPPIVMSDGEARSGLSIDKNDCQKMKDDFINKMKFIAKITRGLYSGEFVEDEEYINFCNSVVEKAIVDKSNNFIDEYVPFLSSLAGSKMSLRALPETKPEHLRSNVAADEFIRIDLDKEIPFDEKHDLQRNLVEKKSGEEGYVELPNCKSSNAGLGFYECLKDKMDDIKRTKKKAVAKKKTKKTTKKKVDNKK